MVERLHLRSINDLLELHFYILYYQRGYRWTPQQVTDLLDDIWAFTREKTGKETEFYCLQPVVVKAKTWVENAHTVQGYEASMDSKG